MPFSKEQAAQIDWSTLTQRILDLRSPLRALLDAADLGQTLEPPLTTNDLHDILTTLDAIAEIVKTTQETDPDATTS